MSAPLLVAATLAAAVWPSDARLCFVSAAAVIVESLPFLFAGILAQRIARRTTAAIPYAGCGCTGGPSARSLPAAALAWIAFGPLVALVRVAAAGIVARCVHRDGTCTQSLHESYDLIGELERLVPFALAAAIAARIAARLDFSHAGIAAQIAVGAAMGFCAPPCALGAVAIASALHVRAAPAAVAFLCVAGIADLNALFASRRAARTTGDAFAYAVVAAGAGLVAFRHGAQLVHPAFAPPLAVCAVLAAGLAIARRKQRASGIALAPAVMLLGALIAVPPPVYRATETTLTELFAGERLSFTGVLSRDGRAAALVRYAITCCRADASPVVVRLAQPPQLAEGTWAHAEGVVVRANTGFALAVQRLTPALPPADPFLYR